MRWLWGVLLVGCGRVAFDPLTTGDAGRLGDTVAVDGFPQDLVAWYPFDDSAANTTDVVGAVNGTCVSGQCPIATAGHHGSAFLFDGVDDCIQIADLGQLDLPSLTVAIWLRQDIQDAESAFAKRVDVGGNVNDSWQAETTTNFEITFTSNHGGINNTQETSASGAILVGTWYHLAMTFDGMQGQLFLDGLPLFSSPNTTGPLNYDSHPMWIGCDNNAAGFFLHWNGALDDLQIYNRALSGPEIMTLASQ